MSQPPAPPPDVQKILEQVAEALTPLVLAGELGIITIHCGASQLYVEVNRKTEPVRREPRPKPLQRQGWENR